MANFDARLTHIEARFDWLTSTPPNIYSLWP